MCLVGVSFGLDLGLLRLVGRDLLGPFQPAQFPPPGPLLAGVRLRATAGGVPLGAGLRSVVPDPVSVAHCRDGRPSVGGPGRSAAATRRRW